MEILAIILQGHLTRRFSEYIHQRNIIEKRELFCCCSRYRAILPSPDFFTKADFIVMESTYGDRLHDNTNLSDKLEHWINLTVENGGNIIIPSFAVGRAQELIYILYQLKEQNKIPRSLPIVMDSPMAASATDIMVRNDTQVLIKRSGWRSLSISISIESIPLLRKSFMINKAK